MKSDDLLQKLDEMQGAGEGCYETIQNSKVKSKKS